MNIILIKIQQTSLDGTIQSLQELQIDKRTLRKYVF